MHESPPPYTHTTLHRPAIRNKNKRTSPSILSAFDRLRFLQTHSDGTVPDRGRWRRRGFRSAQLPFPASQRSFLAVTLHQPRRHQPQRHVKRTPRKALRLLAGWVLFFKIKVPSTNPLLIFSALVLLGSRQSIILLTVSNLLFLTNIIEIENKLMKYRCVLNELSQLNASFSH